jgi:hypothetical protein
MVGSAVTVITSIKSMDMIFVAAVVILVVIVVTHGLFGF